MAATTVNDFYLRYVNETADEQTIMRVSYRATLGWGIVQLVVALGCQWMDRSVLDAGLSILSLTAGPVLGAFLIGFATTRVSATAMLGGMGVGLAGARLRLDVDAGRLDVVRLHRLQRHRPRRARPQRRHARPRAKASSQM